MTELLSKWAGLAKVRVKKILKNILLNLDATSIEEVLDELEDVHFQKIIKIKRVQLEAINQSFGGKLLLKEAGATGGQSAVSQDKKDELKEGRKVINLEVTPEGNGIENTKENLQELTQDNMKLLKEKAQRILLDDQGQLSLFMTRGAIKQWISNQSEYLLKIADSDAVAEKLSKSKKIAVNVLNNKSLIKEHLVDNKENLKGFLSSGVVKKFIAEDKDYLVNLVSSDAVLETVLKNKEFMRRIVGNEAFVESLRQQSGGLNPAIIEEVISSSKTQNVLANNDELLSIFMSKSHIKQWIRTQDEYLLKVADDDNAAAKLSKSKKIAANVLKNKSQIKEHLVDNKEGLKGFLGSGPVKKFIVEDKDFLTNLVSNDSVLETVLKNNEFMRRLVGSDAFVASIRQKSGILNPALVGEVMSSGQAQYALANNGEQLSAFMSQTAVKTWIKNNESYILQLIDSESVSKKISSNKKIAHGAFANAAFVKEHFIDNKENLLAFLNGTEVKKYIVENRDYFGKLIALPGAIETILNNSQARAKIGEDNRFLESLLSVNKNIKKALEMGSIFEYLLDPSHESYVSEQLLKFINSEYGNDLLNKDHKNGYLIDRIRVAATFLKLKYDFESYLTPIEPRDERLQTAISKIIAGSDDLQNLSRLIFEENGFVLLGNMKFELLDWRGFWIAFHEIFINKDYAFSTESPAPLIIDGGANIGLATAYIKLSYPGARVICFEPSERIRKVLERNAINQAWQDVTILPFALSNSQGQVTFTVPDEDSLAGHVGAANGLGSSKDETVTTVPLSQYVLEPVELIKLDIEGQEVEVIEELGEKLAFAKHLFIEYHGEAEGAPQRFERLCHKLIEGEFRFHVSKALGTSRYTSHEPFSHLDGKFSLTIHAKNLK